MDSTQNVSDVIRQEAKAKALAVLSSEPNCTSMVRPEDLETASLFIPIVTIIKPAVGDFYDPIPNIGIMAKPPLMNLIREKSGIEILRTETSKRGEFIYVGHAYGQKRQQDGTMYPDDASYEYDAEKRAEMDWLKAPSKYPTEASKRLHVLETGKFGEQRAVTGAQHALICKMAKVLRSFRTPDELMRGMKVLRIDRNVNGLLADPEMRRAVIDHAIGAAETVYGPKQIEGQPIPRTVDVQSGEVLTQTDADDKAQLPMFPEAEPEAQPEPELSPEDKLKKILAGYKEKIPAGLVGTRTGKTVHQLIDAVVANKKATASNLSAAIDWCANLLQQREEGSK